MVGGWSGCAALRAIIHAETLNTVALKSHVPQIREDLIDFLLRHGSGAVAGQALNAIEDLWSQSNLRDRFSQEERQMLKNATSTRQTRAQLSALAAHLGERREAILQQWRKATENAVELTIASSLTRVQFNDHIPGVLDAFALRLRAWPGVESTSAQQNEKEQVTEHGLQRWQQGYQLRELTREWGHLQMAVMEELEAYALEHPLLEPAVMPTARRAWAQLCWDGISDSATQYWRLHQAEANGHVRELEQALATLNELDRVRASAWREAAHDLQGSMSVVHGRQFRAGRQRGVRISAAGVLLSVAAWCDLPARHAQ